MKRTAARITVATIAATAALGVGHATSKAHAYCLSVTAYSYWTNAGGPIGQSWGHDDACSNVPHTLYLALYKLYQGNAQLISSANRTSQDSSVQPFFTPQVFVNCGNWYRTDWNDPANFTSGSTGWQHPNAQAGC